MQSTSSAFALSVSCYLLEYVQVTLFMPLNAVRHCMLTTLPVVVSLGAILPIGAGL